MNPDLSTNLKPEWQELSAILETVRARGLSVLSGQELSRLGPLYRRAVSDLSIARSRDADPEMVLYLNDLVARGHGLIYTAPPSRLRQAFRFLVSGFPALVRRELAPIGLATAVFLVGSLFAFIIVSNDSSTKDLFLPPMFAGASGEGPRSESSGAAGVQIPDALKPVVSSAIMTNNIQVSIQVFAFGVTFGTLTFLVLLKNGFMLGGLSALYGLNDVSFWSLILPHGIIDLTAIFISGGAGFILAYALIKPGNVSRFYALRVAARRAVPLMGGVAMMLVIAGVIEGFITPSGASNQFKLAFAGMTALLLVLYFLSGRGKTCSDSY